MMHRLLKRYLANDSLTALIPSLGDLQRIMISVCLLLMSWQYAMAQSPTPIGSTVGKTVPEANLSQLTQIQTQIDDWEKQLASGNSEAGFLLGQLYEARAKYRATTTSSGLASTIMGPNSSQTDWQQAIQSYQKAADLGHLGAQNNLASLYLEGIATPRNTALAGQLYRAAAEKNHPEAQYNLSLMLVRDQIASLQADEWQLWLERAANNDLARAQAQLGRLLQLQAEQIETEPETRRLLRETSVSWLSKAALKGEPVAQFHYARALQKGWGMPRDLASAALWYELASNQAYRAADYELGLCYWYGLGIPADQQKARKYLERARQAGIKEAAALLNTPSNIPAVPHSAKRKK
ncbi:tetratricopeptide repeat protein [Parvibium lacunae]|uniref:Sel1 repeat family protein n=1 Tax=Parvibium lacunae TaxID=1888893 RepID=A0A368L813_9BURK|nr:tetratricopeptide repeat protein [Parvibium lacunae]RCS59692.1 sel1 repeat family protein [Parvibium lacunae]